MQIGSESVTTIVKNGVATSQIDGKSRATLKYASKVGKAALGFAALPYLCLVELTGIGHGLDR
jgi:hypothetical protein